MKNVLTFMLGQIATLCVGTGLYMAVMGLAIWGIPMLVGIVFGILALISEKAPSADDPSD